MSTSFEDLDQMLAVLSTGSTRMESEEYSKRASPKQNDVNEESTFPKDHKIGIKVLK